MRVAIFSILASGDVQPWNDSKEFKSAECDKLTDDAGKIQQQNLFLNENQKFQSFFRLQ